MVYLADHGHIVTVPLRSEIYTTAGLLEGWQGAEGPKAACNAPCQPANRATFM